MATNIVVNESTKKNAHSNEISPKKETNEAVKHYINQRKEKAEQQAKDEKNGISKSKLSKREWDEMTSYKYAIF